MIDQRFEALIDAWRDDSLSQHQADELNRALRESSDARKRFAEESQLHGLLHAAVAEEIVSSTLNQDGLPIGRNWSRTTILMGTIAAAALMILAVQQFRTPSPTEYRVDPSARLAEVRHMEDAIFHVSGDASKQELVLGTRRDSSVRTWTIRQQGNATDDPLDGNLVRNLDRLRIQRCL